MSLQLTKRYLFTDLTKWSFDDTELDVISNVLQLIPKDDNPGTFTEDFADDTGFTYDSTKVEFSLGRLQQKQNPLASDVLAYGTMTSSIDLNYCPASSATGTAAGGAAIVGTELDLTGFAGKYVSYADAGQKFYSTNAAIKLKVKPNYSGSPSSDSYILYQGDGSTNASAMVLYHDTSGNIRLKVYDNSSTLTIDATLGAWSPTALTIYEFELNLNLDTGAFDSRLFIDGTQQGSTINQDCARTNAHCVYFAFGRGFTTESANIYVSDMVFYSDQQHTANYTPGYTLEETHYDWKETIIDCPAFVYSGPGDIQALGTLTPTIFGTVKFLLDGKYWNGSAWVTSDRSYSQGSLYADVNTNIAAFTFTDTIIVSLIFPAQGTQGYIDNLTLTYTGQMYAASSFCESLETLYIDDLVSMRETTVTKPAGTALKYILKVDDTWMYVTGGTWSTSDETVDQSNTLAEILTDIATFTDHHIAFKLGVFVVSDTGKTSTPLVTELQIDYDFGGEIADTLEYCLVWGFRRNIDGTACTNTITITLNAEQVKYKTKTMIDNGTITVTPDSEGYWEVSLLDTDNMTSTDVNTVRYQFTFNGDTDAGDKVVNRQVPNEESKDFYLLEE